MPNILLTVDNVSLSFGGLHALQHISFSIRKDSITGLIGPNGAGKTTLFNCLTGFYPIDEGDISLCLPTHTIPLAHLVKTTQAISRLGIVRTFQHSRVFREMTVLENVQVALQSRAPIHFFKDLFNLASHRCSKKKIIEQSFHWLEKFNLGHEANQLAGKLSYGKQKLLEIARAMCIEPLLLCLDEPAAGLNAVETHALLNTLSEIQKSHNLTLILIEHDMSFVMKLCHHIIVLNYGKVICEGSPEYVCQDQKVIDAYLGKQRG